jgi:hypothetical protein
MIRLAMLLVLVLSAALACGGEPPRQDDEVTETWTTGDDAPLESPDAGVP